MRSDFLKKDNKVKDINEYKERKKNKNKKRKRKVNRFKVILSFACIASIMVGNLCGHVKVSELKYDIYYLQKDLNSKQIIIEQLNAKIYSNTSVDEIEKIAKEELNMDYPSESQIEYITVND